MFVKKNTTQFAKMGIALLLVCPFVCVAQTGPGGVGVADGSSALSLWLDANTIVQGNNTNMAGVWEDQSGNNYDASIGVAPRYFSAGAGNGQPALFFDASNGEYMWIAPNTEIMPPNEISIFVMGNFDTGNSTSWASIISAYDDDAGDDAWAFERNDATNDMNFWVENYTTSFCAKPIVSGKNEIWSMVFNTTTNQGDGYISEDNCSYTYTGGLTYDGAGVNAVLLGAGANSYGTTVPGYFLEGDIGEVIIYDEAVNDAQRIIISNYLAAKYAIGLDNFDIYDEDDNGDYDFDVAGIGQTVGAANRQDNSQGTGMVRISNPTGMGDDEFMIWGHDNGSPFANNNLDVPPGVEDRIDRVWRVSEVNSTGGTTGVNVGKVDVAFDLSYQTYSISQGDLVLLIDTNDDGNFADQTPITGANLVGGMYVFSAVSGWTPGFRDGVRFTLGTTNKSQTPLPVSLIEFDAQCESGSVNINWTTESELNNDYFTIERSSDVVNFESISIVAGNKTSSATINYSWRDKSPVDGVAYYRLKQTDLDGAFAYSSISSVKCSKKTEINVYPNPFGNSFTILFSEGAIYPVHVKILDYLGRVVYTQLVVGNSMKISLDKNLPKGTYFVKVFNGTNQVVKRIVKTQ